MKNLSDTIINSTTSNSEPLTMSSREIAELVNSRHDKVKQSIERLADKGVIQLPPMGDVKNHKGQTVSEYRIGKRDSYIIVAQLSPEFTARLVDRWQELEQNKEQIAVHALLSSPVHLLELAQGYAKQVIALSQENATIKKNAEALSKVVESLQSKKNIDDEINSKEVIHKKLSLVAETRRTFGRKAAQTLWQDIGLPLISSEGDKQAVNAKNQLIDYLCEFIEQCFIEDHAARISADEAYKTYCAWAAKTHAPYFTKMHFARIMVKDIAIRRVKSSTSYYCGYRINTAARHDLHSSIGRD